MFFDSYVIIKNDYDSNNAYVLKDPLDMGEQLNYLPLDTKPPATVDCTHHRVGNFSNQ